MAGSIYEIIHGICKNKVSLAYKVFVLVSSSSRKLAFRPDGDVKKLKILNNELHTIFTADESAKKVSLEYCLLFTIAASPLWQNNPRPMFTGHA